jgi:hypothetical protein
MLIVADILNILNSQIAGRLTHGEQKNLEHQGT